MTGRAINANLNAEKREKWAVMGGILMTASGEKENVEGRWKYLIYGEQKGYK